MHSNGTYDWSHGLHPLIWQPGCYFSRFLMHFTILSITTLDHRPFHLVPLRPSRSRSSQSTHLSPITDAPGPIRAHQVFTCPADVRHGRRLWLLSIWVYCGCWVWKYRSTAAAWLTFAKLISSQFSSKSRNMTETGFFSPSLLYGFRWYLGTMNGQTQQIRYELFSLFSRHGSLVSSLQVTDPLLLRLYDSPPLDRRNLLSQ